MTKRKGERLEACVSEPQEAKAQMSSGKAESFEGWAILELMGHRRLAGTVREATIAGAAFVRIDIPAEPPVTQFYAPGAIYCITPTTEEIVRQIAVRERPTPVHRFELTAREDGVPGVSREEDEDGDNI